jgi:hypothetical protein
MHPINISRTTVQHMCNWKGIQILTIWLISKGLLFFIHPVYCLQNTVDRMSCQTICNLSLVHTGRNSSAIYCILFRQTKHFIRQWPQAMEKVFDSYDHALTNQAWLPTTLANTYALGFRMHKTHAFLLWLLFMQSQI